MSRPLLVRLSNALPLLALLACNLDKDSEQEKRALPTPEPASTTPPTKPEAELRDQRTKEPPRREPSEGSPASPKPAAPAPTATSTPTATSDAGAPAPTPSASAATIPGADKLQACVNKCQGSLSSCLAKPIALDGGLPSLESMSGCKKEFEDCQKACSP